MRHTANKERVLEEDFEESQSIRVPKATESNPWVEELHQVSSASAPAWKMKSSVAAPKKKESLVDERSAFFSIDDDFFKPDERPMAPDSASIIKEKEVKDHFHFTDEQLTYTKDMSFGSRVVVTLRKIAVWFSDQWDKYILLTKRLFPAIYETHNAQTFTIIGIFILVALIILFAIGAIVLL